MSRALVLLGLASLFGCERSDRATVEIAVTAPAQAAIVQFEFEVIGADALVLARVRLPEQPSEVPLTARRFGLASTALVGAEVIARVTGFDGSGAVVDSGQAQVALIEDQQVTIEIELAGGGRIDAGVADAGMSDAGASDAGPLDANRSDAPLADAAAGDAVAADAGSPDADVAPDAAPADAAPGL